MTTLAAEQSTAAAVAGIQADFDEFYAANVRGLVRQLYAYLDDHAEAQDVVQEAFTQAFLRWRRICEYDHPAAWVRRVAWNLATNRLRRLKLARNHLRRERSSAGSAASTSSTALTVDGPSPDRVALTKALKTLPPQQRRAVVMHYMGQLPIAEIAEIEGAPEGTVKSWLSRGRAALAAQLNPARKGDN